jgi:ectoine hydroxylase-related dioxygenase (phytanoyl-CoA dioxygenase family)
MGITPAYYKQKIDLPRAIPAQYAAELDDFALQKLGFFSVPPTSLDEYYAPPEKRPYRQSPV